MSKIYCVVETKFGVETWEGYNGKRCCALNLHSKFVWKSMVDALQTICLAIDSIT